MRQLTVFSWRTHGWEVKSRIRGRNLILDALCQRNHLTNQVLQEMDYQDPVRTRIVVRRWEAKRGHTFVIFHVWKISQRGAVRNEDIVVYGTLLDALCDIGQVEDALEILGKILMKG